MKVYLLFSSSHLTQEMVDRIEGGVLTMTELESARWMYRTVGVGLEYKTDRTPKEILESWDEDGLEFGTDYQTISFEV